MAERRRDRAGQVPRGGEPASASRSPLSSIRVKALLLFLSVGLVPVAVAAYRLVGVNEDAVLLGERQREGAVLGEVAGTVLEAVQEARSDVEAIASAISFAASSKATEKDALEAVNALLATRKAIDSVRFEVPSAKIDTVLSRKGVDRAAVPASTKEERALADENNASFFITGKGVGVIVVPVPPPPSLSPNRGEAPRGYVTAEVNLERLSGELERVAKLRFTGEVRLLIVDRTKRVVASYHVPEAPPGADASSLPIWLNIPESMTASLRVGLVSEHIYQGEASIGAIESVDELGWAVAVWRPKAVAYVALETMRREGLKTALGSLLVALLAGLFAARAVTRPILKMAAEARLIGARSWRAIHLGSDRRDELGDLSRALGRMAQDLEESELVIGEEARLRGDLSRFLSKELVEAIVRGDHPMALGGKRAPISVLFADVVAFTPLTESRPAEEVVALLNELFSMLSEIVFRHQGTVDKFIGDCIMGVWGAPVPHADHAARALGAAEDMMRFLETANENWKTKYNVEIRLAIGVNSGEAIVGNVGSNKRMEYTVVGDVVNVAARLEAIAAPNQILVGEATFALAGEEFSLTLLGERKLTGRQGTTRVYSLEP